LIDCPLWHQQLFFGPREWGLQSASDRALTISEFEASDLGVLSNVRCLSEGVEHTTDRYRVFFQIPRNSPIDIVQACGTRIEAAVRNFWEDLAYILVPLIIPEKGQKRRIPPMATAFDGLHNVIQALRDQDETLAEWIDSIKPPSSARKDRTG